MEKKKFQEQVERLHGCWGKTAYPATRANMFWECFKSYPDSFMEKATTKFILNRRTAPMFEDFDKAFRFYDLQRKQQIEQSRFDSDNALDLLNKLENETPANKAFVHKCLANLKNKLFGIIKYEEFLKNCDALDAEAKLIARNKCT